MQRIKYYAYLRQLIYQPIHSTVEVVRAINHFLSQNPLKYLDVVIMNIVKVLKFVKFGVEDSTMQMQMLAQEQQTFSFNAGELKSLVALPE